MLKICELVKYSSKSASLSNRYGQLKSVREFRVSVAHLYAFRKLEGTPHSCNLGIPGCGREGARNPCERKNESTCSKREKRGPMKFRLRPAAAKILAASLVSPLCLVRGPRPAPPTIRPAGLVGSYAYAGAPPAPQKKPPPDKPGCQNCCGSGAESEFH